MGRVWKGLRTLTEEQRAGRKDWLNAGEGKGTQRGLESWKGQKAGSKGEESGSEQKGSLFF